MLGCVNSCVWLRGIELIFTQFLTQGFALHSTSPTVRGPQCGRGLSPLKQALPKGSSICDVRKCFIIFLSLALIPIHATSLTSLAFWYPFPPPVRLSSIEAPYLRLLFWSLVRSFSQSLNMSILRFGPMTIFSRPSWHYRFAFPSYAVCINIHLTSFPFYSSVIFVILLSEVTKFWASACIGLFLMGDVQGPAKKSCMFEFLLPNAAAHRPGQPMHSTAHQNGLNRSSLKESSMNFFARPCKIFGYLFSWC